MEKDGIIFYKKVNAQDEKTRYLRMGNYSLDDIGDIFEKGFLDEKLFPEKDLFFCRKRHYRPFFVNNIKREQNWKIWTE